ncbi:MAG: cytidylate kinase family protein, partial [Calditrichota bacterium]
MAIITIFSATFCQAEKVTAGVAETLGWTDISERDVTETAQKFNISAAKLTRSAFGPPSPFNKFTHDKEKSIARLRLALARLILPDNVVYHGFGTHLLLSSLTSTLKVCIVAGKASRIVRAGDETGLPASKAAKIIQNDDQERAEWTRDLFNKGPWDKDLYDLVLPMDRMTPAEAVTAIVENARNPALTASEKTGQAVRDNLLAAEVNLALAEQGHDVH